MARGRQKSEAKRQAILDAASSCFVEHGFHRCGIHQICTAADISPGALYRYFPSKDAIIEAIAESEREDNASFVRELARTRDLAASLKAIATEVLAYAQNGRYARLAVEVTAEAARNPRVANIIAETDRELLGALTEAVRQAQEAGEVDPALAPKPTAELLLALFDGVMSRFLISEQSDLEALLSVLETLIARFLAPGNSRDPGLSL